MKGNFTFLLPDTHCHTRTVKTTPFSWSQTHCPASQHSTAVEICTGFQGIRLGSCCLTCFWTPSTAMGKSQSSPWLSLGSFSLSQPSPSQLQSHIPKSSRTIPQSHMGQDFSRGNKSQCTSDSKTVTGLCDALTQVHELQNPPRRPSTQDQYPPKPWADDLLWRPCVKPSCTWSPREHRGIHPSLGKARSSVIPNFLLAAGAHGAAPPLVYSSARVAEAVPTTSRKEQLQFYLLWWAPDNCSPILTHPCV